MLKKIIILLGLATLFVIICTVSIFIYLSLNAKSEIEKINTEFNSLMEFAKNESNIKKIVTYAVSTRFSEITIYPKESSDKAVTTSNTINSNIHKRILGKDLAKAKDLAIDSEATINLITEINKGRAIFADPNDNPLQYTRPYLEIEFEGDQVLKVEKRNLL